MSDMRFGNNLPGWVPTAAATALGALTGGLIKGAGSETAKRTGDRLLPKPGEQRKETLTDNAADREALQTLHDAQDYFTTHRDKKAEPLIRDKWSQAVQGAIYQLWIDRKISGDFSKYLLSDKGISLPGIALNGLVLEANAPKNSWLKNLQFWQSKSQKIKNRIEESRKNTNERVDAPTRQARQKAENKYPPTHRANLNGLHMPDAEVNQSAITGGRLHRSVMDRLKARGFHLTGTYARQLSVKDARIDKSEWNEMGMPGANLENTEAFGVNFNDTNFSPHQRRGLPAANMRRFKVVSKRYSPERALTAEATTTFKRSNMTGVDLTEAEMDQPDMTEAQLGQAKVFRSVWQAPNLTKAGLAGLIGFRSAEFQPMPNTAPYKKHPLLALAQATTNSEVNATWDKWFKRPLRKLDALARKNHATKKIVMKEADISGLNFKDKNLAEFVLTNAKAQQTDLSQAYIGKVPVAQYVKRILDLRDNNKRVKLINQLKKHLPLVSSNKSSLPLLTKDRSVQSRIINALLNKKGDL
jgi:uncharacterized protein YjbI with pentapeptide repeats